MNIQKIIKLYNVLRTPMFFHALLKGCAAGVEHRSLLQSMKFDYIVDVGANRGQFALIARKAFPQAIIHSFEPLVEPAEIFKRVFSNDTRVILHPYAIGPEEKQLPMHVSREDDSSSLLPISDLQSSLFPGTEEQEICSIDVKPLKALLRAKDIKTPALLKIDVQGFELEVLKGCQSLLTSFEYIYIECSFMELYIGQALAHQIISWLDERNFICSGVYNLSYDRNGLAIQGDFLFSRNIESG